MYDFVSDEEEERWRDKEWEYARLHVCVTVELGGSEKRGEECERIGENPTK